MPNEPTVYTNARIKEYPKSLVKQVATGAIFPLIPGESKPRRYPVSPPGQAKDKDHSLAVSMRRAKSKVRDLAICNSFEYFFTVTIDPKLLDRYDAKAVYSKVRTFLSHMVQRKDFSYLIVPEYHEQKSGEDRPAIHLHGLCNLGEVRIERARGKSGRRLTKGGRPIYNILDWKYGFSTCSPIDPDTYERAVNYVVKYITKGNGESGKVFGKFYLHSRNLVKGPNTYPLAPENYDEFRDEEKLKAHIQHEGELYSGLRVLSEEFPKI